MSGQRAIYLVRHAVAGERGAFAGPDPLRPLTATGWRQALAVADVLVPAGVRRYLSSPTVRCRDTLIPAAHAAALEVEDEPLLFEDQEPSGPREARERLLQLLGKGPGPVTICTHGNLMLAFVEAAGGRAARCPKGGVWRLEVDQGGDGWASPLYLGRLDPQQLTWRAE
jgi:phosphohistidine phosphatase SixA